MPQDDWRNWGNHPIVVAVTFGAALLSIYTYFEHRQSEIDSQRTALVGAAGAQATATIEIRVPPNSLDASPSEENTTYTPSTGEGTQDSRDRPESVPADPIRVSTSRPVDKVEDTDSPTSEERSSIQIAPNQPSPDSVHENPAHEAPRTVGPEKIQVTGVGFDGTESSGARKKYLARRAAVVDARRNLAEILSTHIKSRTSTLNGELASDEASATVDQILRGARIVGERELPDGGYEVTLEVNIEGGRSGDQ